MYGKAVLALVSFLALLVASSIYLGSVDVRSYFFRLSPPSPSPPASAQPPCAPSGEPVRPLRVYMYDLPRRFNIGMLSRRDSDETPATARSFPPWPERSGTRRQHSVEYWMMASLLYDGGGERREAVRVSDPEIADVFFVPFFSSLSFNTHGKKMKDPETEIDHRLQIDLLEFLRQSKYWQRSAGRDHVIPMTHPNAFRFLRDQVNASILIVADFGRYPRKIANLSKDVVSPYVHFVESFTHDDLQDPFKSRTTLLFFQGGIIRKDKGIIRAQLTKVLAGYDDVHYVQSLATEATINESSQGMRSSKFCLHPAGDTPSSCRLFDAIVSHCIPVIVSDFIELPFEDELDYSEFSIFFSSKEALEPGYMVTQLRQVQKDRWVKMWTRLRNISRHFEFQNPPKKEDAVNMLWRQVKNKLPATKLAVHRSRRLKIPDWWWERRRESGASSHNVHSQSFIHS